MDEPKWIRFVPVPYEAKTKRWHVTTLSGVVIGRIAWSGRWRRYTLQPGYPTEWEQDCLRDIAAFLEEQTKEHRTKAIVRLVGGIQP